MRITRSGLVPRREGEAIIAEIRRRGEDQEERRSGGGDYYVRKIAGLGPGYITLVFAALDAGALTYPTVSALLGGVKANHLDELRDRVGRGT